MNLVYIYLGVRPHTQLYLVNAPSGAAGNKHRSISQHILIPLTEISWLLLSSSTCSIDELRDAATMRAGLGSPDAGPYACAVYCSHVAANDAGLGASNSFSRKSA